jgi:hypothetical protein
LQSFFDLVTRKARSVDGRGSGRRNRLFATAATAQTCHKQDPQRRQSCSASAAKAEPGSGTSTSTSARTSRASSLGCSLKYRPADALLYFGQCKTFQRNSVGTAVDALNYALNGCVNNHR